MTDTSSPRRNNFVAAALATVFAAGVVWFAFMSSVGWAGSLSDRHGFRQTQTALTSYYLLNGGPFLRYETPVLGAPWSIPFELPLYQWLAAKTAQITGMRLNGAGRLVSEVFFVLTLVALFSLLGRFEVEPIHRLVFLILMLVSPLYVFWSRSFMIESAALFFAVAYLDLVLRYGEREKLVYAALACISGALAGLVKVTTFATFLLFAAISVGCIVWREGKRGNRLQGSRALPGEVIAPMLAFLVVPVAAIVIWIYFGDTVKELNVVGRRLVSSELSSWNFGALTMRFESAIWQVVSTRTIPDLVGSVLPVVVSGAAVCLVRRRIGLYWISLFGFASGPLVFTNLHFVHDYYAYANGVFLIAAVAWGVVALLEAGNRWPVVGVVLLGMFLGLSVNAYYERRYPAQRSNGPWAVELVSTVARVTPPQHVVVGFGLDWSSELPYYARRRGLMWPRWMDQDPSSPEFKRAIERIGVDRIGSMVVCWFRPGTDTPGRDRGFTPGPNNETWLTATRHSLYMKATPAYVDRYCAVYTPAGNSSGFS